MEDASPPATGAVPFYSRSGLHVETYDALTSRDWTQRQDDLAFYLEATRAAAGPVLELGCGTGRIAVPLLEAGREVHGLDASPAMLEAVPRKCGTSSPLAG